MIVKDATTRSASDKAIRISDVEVSIARMIGGTPPVGTRVFDMVLRRIIYCVP